MENLGAMAGNEELLKKVSSLEIENKGLKKGMNNSTVWNVIF